MHLVPQRAAHARNEREEKRPVDRRSVLGAKLAERHELGVVRGGTRRAPCRDRLGARVGPGGSIAQQGRRGGGVP